MRNNKTDGKKKEHKETFDWQSNNKTSHKINYQIKP